MYDIVNFKKIESSFNIKKRLRLRKHICLHLKHFNFYIFYACLSIQNEILVRKKSILIFLNFLNKFVASYLSDTTSSHHVTFNGNVKIYFDELLQNKELSKYFDHRCNLYVFYFHSKYFLQWYHGLQMLLFKFTPSHFLAIFIILICLSISYPLFKINH